MNITCLESKDSLKKIPLNAMDQYLTGLLTAEDYAKVLYTLVYHGYYEEVKQGQQRYVSHLYSDVISCLEMEKEDITESIRFLQKQKLITPVPEGGYLIAEEVLSTLSWEEGVTSQAHLDFQNQLREQDITFLRNARLQRENTTSKMVYTHQSEYFLEKNFPKGSLGSLSAMEINDLLGFKEGDDEFLPF